MLPKMPNIEKKKKLNKSCFNFHLLEKTQSAPIGLNAAKNTDYMKKSFKNIL